MICYDAHFHSEPGDIQPRRLLERMEAAGIRGGLVFSPEPESPLGGGHPYETRMACLEAWTRADPDRLFPALFIHPLEPDAIDKARDAADRGVCAFKLICDCYHVYDAPAMALLREIARLRKPVLFHSGILWDTHASSRYNRPLHWECLLEIPGLRFSLAHCGWPWYDECIALYGKFLYAYASRPDTAPEMFLDLTPGTPAVYRRDLIEKLLHSGYDTPHNLLFGTDCTANDYNTDWAAGWVARDRQLLRQAGAGPRVESLYFGENLLRFLGRTPKNFSHVLPVPDRADAWSLERANAAL